MGVKPATTAITAVRTAELLVFFMAEGDAATPAIACGNVNKGFVNKFHDGSAVKARCGGGRRSSLQIKKPRQVGASFSRSDLSK
jgi:hypothetical protein